MSYFYIEPRYNSGERVAGGKLAIYTNESMQNFCDLYRVADFSNPVEGKTTAEFLIANPVTIDNNGINTSPIFIDLDLYKEAYYVIYDAKGAVIRQGYVLPMSWQGGGQPSQGGDGGWGNALVGDPFWGYEVITGLNSGSNPLTGKATTIGRPLYLQTNVAGDKSGGLVIWAVPQGNLPNDSILTFPGNNGRIWRAREEFINYTYLASKTSNPFQYIDNLNLMNGWSYGIRLDNIPAVQNYTYKSKLLIDSELRGSYTTSQSYYMSMIDSANLIITGNAGMYLSGQGFVPFSIDVKGGQFDSESITTQNGENFITGIIDCLRCSSDQLDLKGLTIKKFVLGNMPMNLHLSSTINEIYDLDSNAIFWGANENVPSSELAKLNLRTLTVMNPITILVDADIRFKARAVEGVSEAKLTGNLDEYNNPRAFYVEPSDAYIVDYKFYAKNAELYNVCQFDSSVKIEITSPSSTNSGMGFGSLPAVISNNLVKLNSSCSGKIILNANNSKKLFLNSRTVEVEGNYGYFIYLGYYWGNLKNADVIVDFNVMAGSSWINQDSTFEYRTHGSTAKNCNFIVGSYYAPIITSNGVIFEESEIIETTFEIYGCAVAFSKTKVKNCSFSGKTNFRQVGNGNYTGSGAVAPANWFIWCNNVFLYNDSEITGSKFCRCQIMPINDSKNQMRNIHFDGNSVFDDGQGFYVTYEDKDDNNKPVYAIIKLLSREHHDSVSMEDWKERFINRVPDDGVSFIKMENVTFKANLRNESGAGFSMFADLNPTTTTNRALQGHIEITGDYNYNHLSSYAKGTKTVVVATETFPPWESAIDYWHNGVNTWAGNGEYINYLCMVVLGDPVKYGDQNNGTFVLVDPKIIDYTPGESVTVPDKELTQSVVSNWISTNGGRVPGVDNLAYTTPVMWANSALPSTMAQYKAGLGSILEIAGLNPPYYTVLSNDPSMSELQPKNFPDVFSMSTVNAVPIAGSNYTYNGASPFTTRLFTDMQTAIGSSLPDLPTITATSPMNYPAFFAWTSDGYLVMINHAGNYRLSVSGPGKAVAYWRVNFWNPTVSSDSVSVPGTTTTVYRWKYPVPKTNYVYFDGNNGNVKVFNCLLCCNCNVKLYRIRE